MHRCFVNWLTNDHLRLSRPSARTWVLCPLLGFPVLNLTLSGFFQLEITTQDSCAFHDGPLSHHLFISMRRH